MEEAETVLDKLNEFIYQALHAVKAHHPQVSNYLIYKNPYDGAYEWYILIFFEDATQLNESIKNGVCYQIHHFIWENMGISDDFKDLNKIILFEPGTIPAEEEEIFKIFADAVKRSEGLVNEEGTVISDSPCGFCGHSFSGHQMVGALANESDVPTHGWMICSAENCNCFRTWNYSGHN